MLCAALWCLAAAAHAAIPRILYVGDSWTYAPWNQSPKALRHVLQQVGLGDYEENGELALLRATAADWNAPDVLNAITQKLNQYPTIDTVHISLGGNDLNVGVQGNFSSGHIDNLITQTMNHIRAVVNHCLSVRPNIRVAICGYDYLNIAEGYTWGTWQNPYNPYEIIIYVASIENPTALFLAAWGIHVQVFLPDFPWLGWTTPQQIEQNQIKVNNVFIELERRKKDLALEMNRVTYIHNFGVMQGWYGIPSLYIPANPAYFPDGPGNGYANFPGGMSNRFSPRQAMAGASELDPIHLNDQGYIHLMENAVAQVYFNWLADSTPPTVNSITRAAGAPNPPTGPTADFTVTFSESVTGVDVSDFALDLVGNLSGAVIQSVSGGGSVYTVTVSVPTGDGLLGIDLMDNNTIYDGVWMPLGGPGIDHFTAGQWYMIGTGAPEPPEPCDHLEKLDAQGGALYPYLGMFWELGDFDNNSMIDSWEAAVLSEVLCDASYPLHAELQNAYNVTLAGIRSELYYNALLRPVEDVVATLLLLSGPMNAKVRQGLGDALTLPYIPFTVNVFGSWIEPFAPNSDIDADGQTNKQEYDLVLSLFGTRTDYVYAALHAVCPEGLRKDFAGALDYLYRHRIEIPLVDPICLICEDPMTADLDQNGIVDYAHALLEDALLYCADAPHFGVVAAAWLQNEFVVKAYLNQLWDALSAEYGLPVDQIVGLLVNTDKVEVALTGLVTLGEPASIAAMIALFSEFGISVDASLFNLSAGPILGALGDADDDGVCNLSEFNAVSRDLAGYITFAANALNSEVRLNGGGCDSEEQNNGEEPATCPILDVIDAEGTALYAALGGWVETDFDQNGMFDSWEAALIADVLCDPEFEHYLGARKKYTGNLWRLMNDGRYPLIQDYVHVLAALMTVSSTFAETFSDVLALTGYYYPYRAPAVTGVEMLGGGGDPDGDTLSNKFEYDAVLRRGGTRADYVLAAKTPLGGDVDRCVGLCEPDGGPCGAVDFDGLMRAVDRALDQFRDQLGGYRFDPGIADINGGYDEGAGVIYGNGILDSDEFALINHFMTRAEFGALATNVCNAWNQNRNRMHADLGGAAGLVNT
ncbi:MAG TPA: hypothetical protein PKL84_04975, partial [Candidatus Hydrogenedentes bacterium]|nr:hypothetical protein [Candidatus Hydrogenedentota bacterium]